MLIQSGVIKAYDIILAQISLRLTKMGDSGLICFPSCPGAEKQIDCDTRSLACLNIRHFVPDEHRPGHGSMPSSRIAACSILGADPSHRPQSGRAACTPSDLGCAWGVGIVWSDQAAVNGTESVILSLKLLFT